MNAITIVAIIGGILFLIGLIGGGLEVHGTKIPKVSIGLRLISFLLGIGFLGLAIVCPNPFQDCNGIDIELPDLTTPTSKELVLTIANSDTKQEWLDKVIPLFHAEGKATSKGTKIRVEAIPVLSGGSMNDILEGKLKPIVWSPGVESWVEQFKEEWKQRGHRYLMSESCQPTIYTPLGFTIWRPMAEALGWPEQPVGWQTIVELSTDTKGWERYGHPEWGQFRFGHAHPLSNSGMLTMVSLVYGMTGKTDTLTPAEVYDPKVETALRNLENNTSKYGLSSRTLLELMIKEGPRYLHVVTNYESDTIRSNLQRREELRFPLAFIFPSEGTFWANHPYCILDQAAWVSEEEAEAAVIFRDYLLAPKQQQLAIDSLLRPLDSNLPLHPPLDLEHGTDPRVKPETVPPLAVPNAQVSSAIFDLFLLTKRKATVLVVLDTSGSMIGDKIRTVTKATATFLKQLHADDRVGVLTFSGKVTPLSKPSRVGDVVEELSSQVTTLFATGGTALYEAVCQATKTINELREADLQAGDNRLYGIVLLSDGADTKGRPSENQMFATCLPTHAEADGVKIFPIAFGAEANQGLLKKIADVTGGRLFTANPDSIDKTYFTISAEQ